MDKLSDRERQVLRALGRGRRDKDVADDLGVSVHTVRTHVRNAMRTCGADTREQLIAIYFGSRHSVSQ